MEFIFGLVVGIILGVIAARLFTYLFEKKVYIEIGASYVDDREKGKGI